MSGAAQLRAQTELGSATAAFLPLFSSSGTGEPPSPLCTSWETSPSAADRGGGGVRGRVARGVTPVSLLCCAVWWCW